MRGCVRVTGVGVENVLEGCGRLEWVDVSQCRNLGGWLVGGGVGRWGFDERVVRKKKSSGGGDDVLKMAESKAQGGKMGAGGVGGGVQRPRGGNGNGGLRQPQGKVLGPGPVMRPIIPPRGVTNHRTRKPIRFVVEKCGLELR